MNRHSFGSSLSEGETDMQAKFCRLLALLAICAPLLAMAPVAIARQTPTPEATQDTFTDCGTDPQIDEESRNYPDGLRLSSACVTYERNLQQYTVTARYIIDPDITLNDANPTAPPSEKLAQIGQSMVTVVDGSLTVTITQFCVQFEAEPCAPNGSANVGRQENGTDIVWTPITTADPSVTLNSGDMIYLQDVTATFASGSEGAVITTFGVFSVGGGQGCPAACFHMP